MPNRVWVAALGCAVVAVALLLQLSGPGKPAPIDSTSSYSRLADEKDPEHPVASEVETPRASTRSPVPDDGRAKVAVLTIADIFNQPIQGAQVYLESSEGWFVAGATDSDGRLSFLGGRGVVRHPDYIPREFEVPPGRNLRLALEPGGAIEGVVTGLDEDGMAGCRVVARERSAFLPSWIEEVTHGSPRILETAKCAPDGSFRLTGVVPGREYVVEAEVRGMASAPREVTAGSMDSPGHVTLGMIEVWGALVVFSGPGDEPLHCPERIDVSRSRPARNFTPELPPGFRFASEIYGLSIQRLSGGASESMSDGRYTAVILMTPEPGAGDAPANVAFTFQLPGYEASSGVVQIRSFGPGPATFEFELTPRGESFGCLDVEFLGSSYLDPLQPRALANEYELRLQEAAGETIAMKYSVPLRGKERLEGIPSGTYEAVFEGLGKSVRVVPEGGPFSIGPDLTPSLTIELATFGAIQIELIRADGTAYDAGPIRAQLITETEPGLGLPMFYHLPGPPYLIHHVTPGPHYLVLLTPAELVYRDPDAVPLDTVFVSESSVVTAQFVLP